MPGSSSWIYGRAKITRTRKNAPFRCGNIAIIGRPNVGKSTLLNQILGEKVAIVSPRPQTTRNRITGIRTTESSQIVFLDTPGIHSGPFADQPAHGRHGVADA